MQFTYLDTYGQHQVALWDQIQNLIAYGQINPQTQFFEENSQSWQFLGSIYPQYFQAGPATTGSLQTPSSGAIPAQTSQTPAPSTPTSTSSSSSSSSAAQASSAAPAESSSLSPQQEAQKMFEQSIMKNNYPM